MTDAEALKHLLSKAKIRALKGNVFSEAPKAKVFINFPDQSFILFVEEEGFFNLLTGKVEKL